MKVDESDRRKVEFVDSLKFVQSAVDLTARTYGPDFTLPYDIWNEYRRHRRPPSPYLRGDGTSYRRVRSNVYIDAPPTIESEQPNCCCSSDSDCGDNCLNRMLYTECSMEDCPTGSKCTNTRFQKSCLNSASHDETLLELFDTGDARCRGVRVNKPVKTAFQSNGTSVLRLAYVTLQSGAFVCEYVGEVVTLERFSRRMADWYKHFRHHYAISLTSGYCIDAYSTGSTARFVNHSCQPNCQVQKWNVNGQCRIGLFAIRDIDAGEEVTYDYNFVPFGDSQRCLCNSANCRGTIHESPSTSSLSSISSSSTEPGPTLTNRHRRIVLNKRLFLLRTIRRLIGRTSQRHSNVGSKRNCVREKKLDQQRTSKARLNLTFFNILSNAIASAEKETSGADHSLTPLLKRSMEGHFDSAEQFMSSAQKCLDEAADSSSLWSLFRTALLAAKTASTELTSFMSEAKLAELDSLCCKKNSARKLQQAKKGKDKRRAAELLSTEADLSYLTEGLSTIGRPAESLMQLAANIQTTSAAGTSQQKDMIRCVCAIFEEDGEMVQCDKCAYWLHSDCVQTLRVDGAELNGQQQQNEDVWHCYFCSSGVLRVPKLDIRLAIQPEYRLAGCVYFRTLTTPSGMTVRINDCVFVRRLIDERHKEQLKLLHERCVLQKKRRTDAGQPRQDEQHFSLAAEQEQISRRDVRVFRVERLFTDPSGNRFVFGCYYARPHETFCEPTRLFYTNELFWTPLYDTLPLGAVAGNCIVMDAYWFDRGRPRVPLVPDDNVFLCEFRVDKSQRFFEKISAKNRYFFNSDPYVFKAFKEPIKMARTFTPFVISRKRDMSPTVRSVPKCTIEEILQNILNKQRTVRINRVNKLALSLSIRAARKAAAGSRNNNSNSSSPKKSSSPKI